jgi:hypothetical protein
MTSLNDGLCAFPMDLVSTCVVLGKRFCPGNQVSWILIQDAILLLKEGGSKKKTYSERLYTVCVYGIKLLDILYPEKIYDMKCRKKIPISITAKPYKCRRHRKPSLSESPIT